MNSSILAIEKINSIDKFLSTIENILNYKIVLQLAMRIEVILLVKTPNGKNWYFSQEVFKGLEKDILIREIEFEEDEDSKKEYNLIFTTKIDLRLRRRLSNLIEPTKQNIAKPCPILTFYSYKGGVGRTTTLAFFASWLAQKYEKNVVILDCDFEAPGFSSGNYFTAEQPTNQVRKATNGVIEYLLNKEYAVLANQTLDIANDYAYRADKEFEGNGKIYVIPAGNLSVESTEDGQLGYNHRKDYLEGLARIDITGTHHITKQFETFFADLAAQLADFSYENSVILIDSRTGFNDTFAALATLSDAMVGIFGDNEQNKVGLYEFIDSFGVLGSEKDILIANTYSVLQARETFENFKKIVHEHINNNKEKFEDEQMGMKAFVNTICKLEYSPYLANWGTNRQEMDRIIRLIGNPYSLFDTEILLEKLFDLLDKRVKEYQIREDEKKKDNLTNEVTPQNPVEDNENLAIFLENSKDKVSPVAAREQLLKKLSNNLPTNYALEIPEIGDFFFRDCMKDLFKKDKFLLVGYKGTGKTLLYLAFQNPAITQKICEYYQERKDKYLFVNVVPVHNQEQRNLYFTIETNFSQTIVNNLGKEYFYKSFWLLYSWNAIFSHPEIKNLATTKPIIETFAFDIHNAQKIANLIADNNKIFEIQENLNLLDKEIAKKGKIIILSYDQIDFITAPHHWKETVSPLINYWRINPFAAIYPKIFLRTDIYEQGIGNITNSKELANYELNLAWSREELFSYWFKFVFKTDKKTFMMLCYQYSEYLESAKQRLLSIDKMLEKDNQLPVSKEAEIKFLVENFFGKYANKFNTGENYGTSYEWFNNNLTDGKGMISIRPFRDLMLKSMEIALQETNLQNEIRHYHSSKQVLSAFFYAHKEATTFYSEAYYNDLAGGDNNNSSLFVFYDYVTRVAKRYEQVYEFTDSEFDNLLKQVINKNIQDSRLTVKTVDGLKVLLTSNGIFKVEKNKGKQKFIMPFLYRNYFKVGKPEMSVVI